MDSYIRDSRLDQIAQSSMGSSSLVGVYPAMLHFSCGDWIQSSQIPDRSVSLALCHGVRQRSYNGFHTSGRFPPTSFPFFLLLFCLFFLLSFASNRYSSDSGKSVIDCNPRAQAFRRSSSDPISYLRRLHWLLTKSVNEISRSTFATPLVLGPL